MSLKSFRARVLAATDDTPRTGKEIASRAGVPYFTALYALNALADQGKVQRTGKKKLVRWSKKIDCSVTFHTDEAVKILESSIRFWGLG